ncbi:MAG: SEC-C metal-binding domain-containing protein [Chloroflexota bacterium]
MTRQPAAPAGGDPAVAASLARGAAALAGGNGSNGTRSGAPEGGELVAAGAAASTPAVAVAGSAILRGGPSAPASRPMRESLGDEPVIGGNGATSGGPKPGFTPSGARIGRNDACWCGSGLKYKKCHGR